MTARLRSSAGQGLIEFALVLPLFVLLALGVIEAGYAMVDQHTVTTLSREGSNLISRETSLEDAATAMQSLRTAPVDFGAGGRMIFSVIRRGATPGTANYDKDILYQRYQVGGLARASRLTTRGAGAFGGAPDFQAMNPDHDVSLQITNLPPAVVLAPGGMVYVTEVYAAHPPITPLGNFGIAFPDTLYSIAYF